MTVDDAAKTLHPWSFAPRTHHNCM